MSDSETAHPRYFRSAEDAAALRPAALAFIDQLEALLPHNWFNFDRATLFVGRTVEPEVGCIAVTVPGRERSLTALEFLLADDPEEYVEPLMRYREKLSTGQ